MLENIRENSQGMIAKVILGFVILTFAIAGIGSYTNSVDTSVAEVNGEKISQQDFNQAYQAQRRRMEQQFGEMFNTLAGDSTYMANFRNGVLDNLINEKLLDQSVRDLSLRVSDDRIKETIRTMPEFQVNGTFDNNRYLAIINQAGFYQSSDFRDYLRVEITRRQLNQALVSSEFSLPYQHELMTALQNQTRDIRFATIKAEQFEQGIEISEQEINNYYLENQNQFETQEQVKVNYVVLDVNEIAKTITITDADVEAYYQDNIDSFTQAEQRRVAHILVEFGDDQDKAQEKIDAILVRLTQGEDFAEVAKTSSDDTFSGENGGDLEWLELGVMEPAFEEAAYALANVGDMTDVVETSFGFHIIKLTDLKATQIQPFSEISDELHQRVSRERAQDKFFELQQELAQISFEYPDTLEDAAAAVGAKVMTTDWLKRFGNVAPFDSPKVIDVAFSDLVIRENVNSDIIEVNDDLAMVVRLNKYQAAEVKPLAEVSEDITKVLVGEKATEQALTKAEQLLTTLKSGDAVEGQLSELSATFEQQTGVTRFANDVDATIRQQAFVLPHPADDAVSASTVTLANGDLALVQVTAVNEVTGTADANLANQQTSQLAQLAYQSYIETLKTDAKVIRRAIQEPANGF